MPRYTTIANPVDTEIEIQRSRFLTHLERVTSEKAAREIITQVKSAHPRARHHCTAFVIGADGRLARHNDDGEPSGTAGAPMLEALTMAGLSDVVATVTRYFGGVLLGAGGLTRAYRTAVATAIAQAKPITRELLQAVTVQSSYDVHGGLVNEMRKRGSIIGEAKFSEIVCQTFWVEVGTENTIIELASLLSAGAAIVTLGEQSYCDMP